MKTSFIMMMITVLFISCSESNSEVKSDDDFEPTGEERTDNGLIQEANELPEQNEEIVGSDDDQIEKTAIKGENENIENYAKDYLYLSNGSGHLLMVDNGKKREYYEAGYAKLADENSGEEALKMNNSNLFYIASVTKTFTAMTAIRLIEEGKLSFDDTLSKWYPEYEKADKVTVRMLLDQTSGHTDFIHTPSLTSKTYDDHSEMVLEYMEEKLGYTDEPGARFSYSNINFIILGVIIEKVSGDSYCNSLKKLVLTPLGLENTYCAWEETGYEERLAEGYFNIGDMHILSPLPEDHINRVWAAGSLISSADDLTTFFRAIFDRRFIGEELVEELLKSEQPYKFGMFRTIYDNGTAFGHAGDFGCYRTIASYFPEKELSIVSLHSYSPNHGELWNAHRDIVQIIEDEKYDVLTKPESSFFEKPESELYAQFKIRAVPESSSVNPSTPRRANAHFIIKENSGPYPFIAVHAVDSVEAIFQKSDSIGQVFMQALDIPYLQRTGKVRLKMFYVDFEFISGESGEYEFEIDDSELNIGVMHRYIDAETGELINSCRVLKPLISNPGKVRVIKSGEKTTVYGNFPLTADEDDCDETSF